MVIFIQKHTEPSRTKTNKPQEEPTVNEQPPSVLPEGQYYVEKLLAKRKRVWWKRYPLEYCLQEWASNIGSKARRLVFMITFIFIYINVTGFAK